MKGYRVSDGGSSLFWSGPRSWVPPSSPVVTRWLHIPHRHHPVAGDQRCWPADGLTQQPLQLLALLRLQQRQGLDDAAVRAKGPVVALAAVLPVAPIGGSSPHQGPKPITVDVDLQLPAAGQIELHPPPPDLTPGFIRQEGLPRQNGQQGLLDLGGAATAQGEQSG